MDQRFEPCLASPLLRFTPKQGQYLALRQWFVGFCQGRPELAVNPLLRARDRAHIGLPGTHAVERAERHAQEWHRAYGVRNRLGPTSTGRT
jgi:uncharacterized protein YfaT (DUF1175 family)